VEYKVDINRDTIHLCFLSRVANRNFILNEDLALDYDTAGLAVSATFAMGVSVFVVLLVQVLMFPYKLNGFIHN
jgi:hypothetical protein